MNRTSEILQETYLIQRNCFSDKRGSFWKFYSDANFTTSGESWTWKDLNICTTKLSGTFRGLHYQLPPHAERKLIGCIEGEILDVLFDLRPDSKTFKQSALVKLKANSASVILIPEGIAHGYLTLKNNTTVAYLSSTFHNAEYERVISWREPLLKIEWPIDVSLLSEKDAQADVLTDRTILEIISAKTLDRK
jgi:dTDP-4-dehydrorhamnose 3,5-epimerase